MSDDRESIPRGFENPYQIFVWRELTVIRELERNGYFYRALELAVSLLKYLQPEVRKKQEEEAKIILDRVRHAIASCPHIDFYIRAVTQNKVAKRLGYHYLQKVITALTDQLGDRAYMEKGAVAPHYRSPRKLSV